MIGHIEKIRKYSSVYEPYWTIVGAPIFQEVIFRFMPYQYIYLKTGNFWETGIISSILYALIHFYYGVVFSIGTFLFGLILWFVMVRFGLLEAILLHVVVDAIVWFAWRRRQVNL